MDADCPKPLPDQEWPAALEDLRAGFAGKLNVYRVMAHHPALLRAWAPLRAHIVTDSALGAARSEVVILRTAHRFSSAYEWAHHVSRGRKVGLSDKRIAAIAATPKGEDALICRAVDALLDQHHLPSDLDRELVNLIGRHGVFDLIATVGFYSVLGYILMSYDTPLDTNIAEELSQHPLDLD